jgi:hypothetical protein
MNYRLKQHTVNLVKNNSGRQKSREKSGSRFYLYNWQLAALDSIKEELGQSRNEVLRRILSEALYEETSKTREEDRDG